MTKSGANTFRLRLSSFFRHSAFGLRHSKPNEIEQELAPEINHSSPRIFHFAVGRGFEDAFLNVMRDLIPQIVLDLELDAVFVHRIDHARLNLVLPQEFLVALVELPE